MPGMSAQAMGQRYRSLKELLLPGSDTNDSSIRYRVVSKERFLSRLDTCFLQKEFMARWRNRNIALNCRVRSVLLGRLSGAFPYYRFRRKHSWFKWFKVEDDLKDDQSSFQAFLPLASGVWDYPLLLRTSRLAQNWLLLSWRSSERH